MKPSTVIATIITVGGHCATGNHPLCLALDEVTAATVITPPRPSTLRHYRAHTTWLTRINTTTDPITASPFDSTHYYPHSASL